MSRFPSIGKGLSSLRQRLLGVLGIVKLPKRTYCLEDELAYSVHALAEVEQCPEEEVVAGLLTFALAHRNAAEINLDRWKRLSPREQQVAALTCMGYLNVDIAERLMISPETVKSHVRNILRKFNMHRKSELRLALVDWDFSAWEDTDFGEALE